MTGPPSLLTIPAAARAAEVPERSLYRAVDAGEVGSTTRDGTKLVALDDVVAWREARKAARLPLPPLETLATAAPSRAPEPSSQVLPTPAASGGNEAAATGGMVSGSAAAPAMELQKFNSSRAAGQHEDALVNLKRELAKLAAEVTHVWPSIGAAQQSADEAVFKIPAVKRELEEQLASLEQRVAAIERYLQTRR